MKICIEGNIGCGKTSVMRKVHDVTRLPVFLEPVDEWADWLNMFYQDPSRWGFTFNVNVLMTFNRWKGVECEALYERSPMSCKEVFMQLQHNNGHMNAMEYELFKKVYQQVKWSPDVIIYLKADPDVCMQRMTRRGRSCENSVPIDYLRSVHERYEDMIQKAQNEGIRVFVIDANNDADTVYDNVMSTIKSFMM